MGIVRNKIKGLAVYDSIQIYLGYLAGLRKYHDLPLNMEDLSLFRNSSIPLVELLMVSSKIDLAEADITNQAAYLVNQNIWQEALSYENPLIYAEKKDNHEALSEWTKDILHRFASSSMETEN